MSAEPPQTSDLGRAVQDVSEKLELLVREEVELAKAEMTEKASKLVKGAVFGAVAGVFALFALIYLLEALSWGIYDLGCVRHHALLGGFLIVGVLLLVLGGIARLPRRPAGQGGLAADAADGGRGGQADQGDARQPRPGPARGRRARTARGAGEAGADGRRAHRRRRSVPRSRPTAPSWRSSVEYLRGEVTRSTDWREQFCRHKREVLIGAAVAGFVLGGGIAALTWVVPGRR